MATTIVVANQKGGVGKTTSVVNIAAFSVIAGRRVLVVDLDSQGNASSVLAPEADAGCVFSAQEPLSSATSGLDICPRGNDLEDWERILAGAADGASRLGESLERLGAGYDLIIIDCPPNLSTLPSAAIQAADQLIIPIQCEYYALEGLGQILSFLEALDGEGLQHARLAGILLTMFDDALALSHQVASEIGNHFKELVFQPPIPRDVALAAAPSHSRSIIDHDPLSPGALAYLAVTKELLHAIE